MKKWFAEPKNLFTLLMISAVIAIAAGVYLGVVLGLSMGGAVTALSAVGMLLWTGAWGEFLAMCLRLRKGETAFTASTGRTLRIIGWCMVGLAVETVLSALIGGTRESTSFWLIELVILPVIFLGVAVVAKILRGLLEHAMSLEEEQEGVV